MKRFRFPNRIVRVNIPFMLHDYRPWQEQISEKLEKSKKRYGTNKTSQRGYIFEYGRVQIYIFKTKP